MIGKWNIEFGNVNLIKEIKLGLWLKASFYNNHTQTVKISFISNLIKFSESLLSPKVVSWKLPLKNFKVSLNKKKFGNLKKNNF